MVLVLLVGWNIVAVAVVGVVISEAGDVVLLQLLISSDILLLFVKGYLYPLET
jgi:hypothetical protein